MPAHLCAYAASISPNVETELAVVPDDVLTQSGTTRFYVPADINNIHWAAALGTTLTRAKIRTPSLITRRITLDIIPHVKGAIKFPTTFRTIAVQRPPVSLVPTEEMSVLATQGAAGAETEYALIQLGSPALEPVPAGDVRRVRCTAAKTLTANQWTTCTITPEETIEAGTYALIGMLAISANAIAARALLPGQVYRPGVPAIAGAEADAKYLADAYLELMGGFLFGSFPHNQIPQVQFLSSAADTSEVVYLYMVKTA